MTSLPELFARYHFEAKGVIHIGGDGAELDTYLQMGFKRILFIEANPAVYERLARRLAEAKQLHALGIQCAVMDANGYAELRVMSNDQASSLLQPKELTTLYPDIHETGRVLTPMRRLDTLLVELGVHPQEFNYLSVDVQGAEQMVLIGAEKTVRYLDVIQTEVYTRELYAGCQVGAPEFPGVENFFVDHGEVFDDQGGWLNAWLVRKPILNLWQNPKHGRFANEIFHYWFARQLCAMKGVAPITLHTAPWAGQSLFGLNDPLLTKPLPLVDEHDPRPEHSGLWRAMKGSGDLPANICIFGNFQFHTGLYDTAQREEFCRMFAPVPPLKKALMLALEKAMGEHKTLVAIHLRRGDYAEGAKGMFYRTPAASYKKWLADIWPLLDKPVLYVASDDPAAHGEFQEYTPLRAADLAVPIQEQYYVDFWVMTQAHALAISNSSFSFAAAMLNLKEQQHVVRPTMCVEGWFVRPLRNGAMRSFDPWKDDVLLGRYDDPAYPSSEEMCLALLTTILPKLDPDRKGDFIEVGCGTFAYFFSVFARMGWRCHAIEPLPTPQLEAACEAVGATLTQCVISELNEDVDFFAGRTPDLSYLDAKWWGLPEDKTPPIRVRSVRLNTFIARTQAKSVACLKLDVEGAEERIVRQLQNVTDDCRPGVVMFEYGGTPRKEGKGGWTTAAMANTLRCFEILLHCGYTQFWVLENHREPKDLHLSKIVGMKIEADTFFDADAEYGNIVAAIPAGEPLACPELRRYGGVTLDGPIVR